MSAVIMDGKKLRDDIVAELRAEIEAAGSPPVCLATVLVGDDKPSQIYVRSKQKKAAEALADPVEHLGAQRVLEEAEGARHRGRGQPEATGGGGDAAGLGDLEERRQPVPQVPPQVSEHRAMVSHADVAARLRRGSAGRGVARGGAVPASRARRCGRA